MAGEIIATTDIPRTKGYLFVCGTSQDGNLTIIKIKAGRKAKPKEEVKV